MAYKIIVTGGCGYIGSHTVIELLENGFEVVILDDLSNSNVQMLDRITKITGRKPEFVKVDLKNLTYTQNVFRYNRDADAVIHGLKIRKICRCCDVRKDRSEEAKYYKNMFTWKGEGIRKGGSFEERTYEKSGKGMEKGDSFEEHTYEKSGKGIRK